jgi:hypothetical protein
VGEVVKKGPQLVRELQLHTGLHAYVCVCVLVYMCVCVYALMCAFKLCMYVCVCVRVTL